MIIEWWRRLKRQRELKEFERLTWFYTEAQKQRVRRDMRRLGYKPTINKASYAGSEWYECVSQNGKKWGAGPTPMAAYESWAINQNQGEDNACDNSSS